MTCQHCQTWILDDDHRCRRCGRRVRSTPARISPHTFPIAAAATAEAYDFSAQAATPVGRAVEPLPETPAELSRTGQPLATERLPGQQTLFATPLVEPRVIPFESLTPPGTRQMIRERAAELPRPKPLKTGRVEVRRTRSKKLRSDAQRRLEFQGQEEMLAPPQSSIICDAPVAPVGLRVQAGMIDLAVIAGGWALLVGALQFACKSSGLQLSFDKHTLPFLAMALMTLPLAYKLLWTFTGRDTIGIKATGLRLVNFDGNPPSAARRYQRLFGSILSLMAAGVGLIWCLVDEDCLTWHDHISATFLTFAAETDQ